MKEADAEIAGRPARSFTAHGPTATIFLFIALAGIAAFTYFIVPTFVTPFYAVKPEEAQRGLGILRVAAIRYATDHGQPPDLDDMLHYRRLNKNVVKSKAYGIRTYRMAALTTPVAYVTPGAAVDVYALPEQFPPFAVLRLQPTDGEGVLDVFSSPGPNLIYDIRPEQFAVPLTEAEIYGILNTSSYDPTNGLRGGGDFYRAARFPLPSASP